MKKQLLFLSAALFFCASCKKECEKENFGYFKFQNVSGQNLKIKVNNAVPAGCLAANNGNLADGNNCEAEITANVEQDVIVLTDSNTTYWEFQLSVGPCGNRTIKIQ